MELIDLLIYCLIIVLITAITICVIYYILKYAANRREEPNERSITLLPMHERNNLIKKDIIEDTQKPRLSVEAKRKQYVMNRVDEFIRLSITRNSANMSRYCESLNEIYRFTTTDRDILIQAGIVPYFIKLLFDDTDTGIIVNTGSRKISLRTSVARELQYLSLTDNKKCIQILIEDDCIPAMVRGLNDNDLEKSKCCASTLANIRSKCDIQFHDYIDACIIATIIKLLKSHDKQNWIKAAEIIYIITNDFIWNEILKTEVIPLLVNLLKSQDVEICKIPIKALSNLAKGKLGDKLYNFEGKEAVIKAGALPYFVKFLRSSDLQLRYKSFSPLIHITVGTLEQRQAVIDAGAVTPSIENLSSADKKICTSATLLLINLSSIMYQSKDIINVVPQLIKNLYSDNKALIFATFILLKTITHGTSIQCQAIFEANVISNLKQFFNTQDLKIVQLTLIILDNISDKLPGSIKDIATPDIVSYLIKFLNVEGKDKKSNNHLDGTVQSDSNAIVHIDSYEFLTNQSYELLPNEIQKRAIKILYKIASENVQLRRLIIQSNGIPEIIKHLNSSDAAIHELTTRILEIFAKNSEIDKDVLIKSKSFQHIVEFLNTVNTKNRGDNTKNIPKMTDL